MIGDSMTIMPSPERCIALLQESGCSEHVIAHCKAVRDIAVRIAKKANADVELVEAGALLHDIGRSKTHGVWHGIEGARIAQELKLPEQIVFIIERHLGAGIPKKEAIKLGLPPKDYLPISLEEKIVAHADNLIDHLKKQSIQHEIDKAIKKDMPLLADRLQQLHQELSEICNMDLDEI
jgi:uncharacterized protein (TIGR00295 family)